MKFFIIIIIILGAVLGSTTLLPKTQVHSNVNIINCPPSAANRIISNLKLWKSWWPGAIMNDSSLVFDQHEIHINNFLQNGINGKSQINKIPISIDFQFIAAPGNKVELTFSYELFYDSNPIKRAFQYIKNKSIHATLNSLTKAIILNLENVKIVYGFDIKEELVPNSSHISIKKELNRYPTTEDIYSLVDKLNSYIMEQKAKAINKPIYNTYLLDNSKYQLMVAIATDRALAGNELFQYKEMVKGKIIIGHAIGSDSIINECQKQVRNFLNDYGKSSPAIQFNRLIINRRMEKDSSKWVTTINYPVFD